MRIPFLAVLIFLCTSCGTTYLKPGATNTDFYRDNNDCLVKAGQAGYLGGSIGANIARNRFIGQCLQGQGWIPQ